MYGYLINSTICLDQDKDIKAIKLYSAQTKAMKLEYVSIEI